jgi:hypothetical protein
MEQVYLVTESANFDGVECTDIIGVFASKKLAELFINSYSNNEAGYSVKIEKHKINPFRTELKQGLKYYFLRMTKEGNVYDLEISSSAPREEITPYLTHLGFCVNNHLFYSCFAKDEEDAIELCNNERLRIISENRWPGPESCHFLPGQVI